MDIEYKRVESDSLKKNENDYLDQLVVLSKEWAVEKSNPSYQANDAEYYQDKEVFVAVLNNEIIAYALGEINVLKEETSYNKIGETAFELDELFVSKMYRNKKVGRQLFKYLETSVRPSVDLIGVVATSFRYEELLDFYINDLDLSFNHALLVKRI